MDIMKRGARKREEDCLSANGELLTGSLCCEVVVVFTFLLSPRRLARLLTSGTCPKLAVFEVSSLGIFRFRVFGILEIFEVFVFGDSWSFGTVSGVVFDFSRFWPGGVSGLRMAVISVKSFSMMIGTI
jgi:hypothetical protein